MGYYVRAIFHLCVRGNTVVPHQIQFILNYNYSRRGKSPNTLALFILFCLITL
jgi:hypothetical protein